MKKTFRIIGLAIAAIMLTFGAASCSDDDDNDKNLSGFNELDSALVGTWTKVESGNGWSDTETIVFNANGTYEETEVEVDHNGTKASWDRGTWKTNATKDRVRFEINASSDPSDIGDVEVDKYKVVNGVLTIENETYTLVQ